MQEIADISGGISRERVRQLLKRNGLVGRTIRSTCDPLLLVNACRRPGVRTWEHVDSVLGVKHPLKQKRATLSELGLLTAVRRLFRWRRQSAKRKQAVGERARLIASYQGLANRLGRVPASEELCPENGTPYWVHFFNYFDGMSDLRVSAGLDSRDRRSYGARRPREKCKRGHLFAETRGKWGGCGVCRKDYERRRNASRSKTKRVARGVAA
jgi:hypothetical protein